MSQSNVQQYLSPLISQVNNHLKQNETLSSFINCFIDYPLEISNFQPILSQIKQMDRRDYSRIKIYVSQPFEILLLHWPFGCECKVHRHPERGCLFKILEGELLETRFDVSDLTSPKSEETLKTNQAYYIDDSIGYHKVSNTSPHPAVSLHIYSPGGTDHDKLILT